MTTPPSNPREGSNSEEGYILLAVLFLVALILIGLAVAAPKVAQDIQRDRENELYHRGKQYERAIRLYYRKTGGYPTDLSQLENTNNIRFLRKRYIDPITGQPFRLIHQGEAKAPLLGLFGQPLAGQIPGATSIGNPIGSSPTGATPTGATSQNGSAFGSSSFGSNTLASNTLASSDSQPTTSPGDNTGNPGTGSTGAGAGNNTGTDTGFGSTGSTGSTTVVGRIVGVSSTSPKASIRVYKKQTHYNQWEFVYDPAMEAIAGGGQPALNAPGLNNNPAQGTQGTGVFQPNQPQAPTSSPISTPTPTPTPNQ
jgi:type II secretory pathway pseudopilin PulG